MRMADSERGRSPGGPGWTLSARRSSGLWAVISLDAESVGMASFALASLLKGRVPDQPSRLPETMGVIPGMPFLPPSVPSISNSCDQTSYPLPGSPGGSRVCGWNVGVGPREQPDTPENMATQALRCHQRSWTCPLVPASTLLTTSTWPAVCPGHIFRCWGPGFCYFQTHRGGDPPIAPRWLSTEGEQERVSLPREAVPSPPSPLLHGALGQLFPTELLQDVLGQG